MSEAELDLLLYMTFPAATTITKTSIVHWLIDRHTAVSICKPPIPLYTFHTRFVIIAPDEQCTTETLQAGVHTPSILDEHFASQWSQSARHLSRRTTINGCVQDTAANFIKDTRMGVYIGKPTDTHCSFLRIRRMVNKHREDFSYRRLESLKARRLSEAIGVLIR